MQKNDQLELAYNFVQYTNKNIFLTGKAGTGKTTFLHNLKRTSLKRMAVVAPTGVAAINAGGVTIHSFFQMPFGPYIAQSLSGQAAQNAQQHKKFNREKINLIQSLDLLVIDEISMVRADLLDGIDEILRRYKDHSQPFGGVQLLMIGDLHQLSPVVKEEDWRILKDFYSSLYFFGSHALQQTAPVCIELKHIYRQSDTHFIDLLNRVRENQLDREVLEQLNGRHIPGFMPADEEGYITLTTHNHTAQTINEARLAEIKKPSRKFKATVNNDFPEYSYPTVPELELKAGAQVMFVKNDPSRDRQFYNGKIGRVTRMEPDTIYVKCPGDDSEIAVGPAEWQNIRYDLNTETKEIEEKVIGSFIQFPLKLAWAITIHKSQGLTFEKAIIDAEASFAHGQVYVALSRCKSFEGLVLRSPIRLGSVKTDETVASYTRNAEENQPGEQFLTESKITFQQSLIRELFNFDTVKRRLFYLNKQAQENDNTLAPAVADSIIRIREKAEQAIFRVAQTFEHELNRLFLQNRLPEENEALQDRIKKACAYFTEKTRQELYRPAQEISIETDNKAVRKTVSEALENLKKEVFVKLSALKQSLSGFSTIDYLKTKANAEIDFNLAAKQTPSVKTAAVPADIPHAGLYAELKRWRNALAEEHNWPVYLVLPQKALTEISRLLPSSVEELKTIKGIGKQKSARFGPEIIRIVSAYCEENHIAQTTIKIPAKEEKIKTDTKKVSFDLYKKGKPIAEIASERGLTPSTIEGHLAHFIGTGEIDLYHLVPKDKADKIIELFTQKRELSLNQAKAALGDEVSYGDLKAVIKHLEFLEVQSE